MSKLRTRRRISVDEISRGAELTPTELNQQREDVAPSCEDGVSSSRSNGGKAHSL